MSDIDRYTARPWLDSPGDVLDLRGRAARVVVRHATGPGDAALLLEMLGLPLVVVATTRPEGNNGCPLSNRRGRDAPS